MSTGKKKGKIVMNISYRNGKGKRVEVDVTRHAVLQFQDRFKKLYGSHITALGAQERICNIFPNTDRVYNLKLVERQRAKKYKEATLYFRDSDFTFIVADGFLLSVEISRRGERWRN